MKRQFIFYSFCLLFVISCDYGTGMTGKVIDKETGKPISNATVNLLDGKDIAKTNETGYFEVYRQGGSHKIVPEVLITKKGYKPFQIRITSSDEGNSYTVKSETKDIEYDEPLYLNSDKSSFTTGTTIEKWSQNFSVSDTLTIYLTKDDEKAEVKKIKMKLKANKW